MFSLSILFYIRCFIVHFILQTRTPPCSDVSFFSSWACYFLPTCDEKGNMCSHPKEDSAYSCRNTRSFGNDTRPDKSLCKHHILARICSFSVSSKLPSITKLSEHQGDAHRSAYRYRQPEGYEKNHCYCLHNCKF